MAAISIKDVTLEVISYLPKKLLDSLNLENEAEILEAVNIHMAVSKMYKDNYANQKELNQKKQRAGFCSGMPNCFRRVGKNQKFVTCNNCRAKLAEQRKRHAAGETRPLTRSEYGIVRILMKKEIARRKAAE